MGNLVSRSLTLAEKINKKDFKNPDVVIKDFVDTPRESYQEYINNFKFNEALAVIWEIIACCDRYIEKEKPWDKGENYIQVVSNLLFALKNIADYIAPFLPETSEKILKQLKSKKPEPIFPRIK